MKTATQAAGVMSAEWADIRERTADGRRLTLKQAVELTRTAEQVLKGEEARAQQARTAARTQQRRLHTDTVQAFQGEANKGEIRRKDIRHNKGIRDI